MIDQKSIFEKNMYAWEKKFGGGQDKIRKMRKERASYAPIDILCEKSLDGENILIVTQMGRKVYLGGRRNCVGPATDWANSYGELQPASTLFLVGIGNPFYFKEACRKFDEEIRILVYEPSLAVFLRVLENFDLSKELKTKRPIIFLVDELNDYAISSTVSRLIDVNMMPYFKMFVLPNYRELFTEKIKSFSEIVAHECEVKRVGLNTGILFSGVSGQNLLSNIRYVPECLKTKQFVDYIPHDIPAIVVAAGPSLDKNIKELKKAKGRAFIIAVDTAIKPLLKEGIRPDMFAVVDGMKPLSLIETEGAEHIPMLASLVSASSLFEFHKGRKVFFNEYYPVVNHMFHMNKVSFESVPCGGSVATTAFAFAYMIGIETIILVGQDLALEGKRTHASGTFEDYDDDSIFSMVPGNYEKEVITRDDFRLYLNWYNWYIKGCQESGAKLRVINATEGGAKIQNTEIMTLKEAIEENCTKEFNFEKVINEIPCVFNESQQERAKDYIRHIPEEFREIQELSVQLKSLYEELSTICKKKKLNKNLYLKTLKKIKKLTQKAESHVECMALLSSSLKVADFILKSEQNLKQQEPKEEGLEISRQGLIYTDLLYQCSKMYAEYCEDLY